MLEALMLKYCLSDISAMYVVRLDSKLNDVFWCYSGGNGKLDLHEDDRIDVVKQEVDTYSEKGDRRVGEWDACEI